MNGSALSELADELVVHATVHVRDVQIVEHLVEVNPWRVVLVMPSSRRSSDCRSSVSSLRRWPSAPNDKRDLDCTRTRS